MIDAILYVPSFSALVAHLIQQAPNLLEHDEHGEVAYPPVITGFARTPAVVNGDELMVYARFTESEAEQWRGTEGVVVLAEANFVGAGTGDAVYEQLFSDEEALTIYDRVYDRAPIEVIDDNGERYHHNPPTKFGILAGA